MSKFSLTNILLMDTAKKRGWKVRIIDEKNNLIEITPKNSKPYIFNMALSVLNSGIGHEISTNKDMTRIICEDHGLPHPFTVRLESIEDAESYLKKLRNVVIKPADTDHGVGITLNVNTPEQLLKAINNAKQFSNNILMQELVPGLDHRFLVVDDSVVAVGRRKAPEVVGDGVKTIRELVEELNEHKWRGEDHSSPLSIISLDDVSAYVDNIDLIPSDGENMQVLGVANLSKGGIAVDMTDIAHDDHKKIAIKLAQILDLRVAGVDILCTDISKPRSVAKSVILEVNKIPGIRMHHYPMSGTPRDAAGAILDALATH